MAIGFIVYNNCMAYTTNLFVDAGYFYAPYIPLITTPSWSNNTYAVYSHGNKYNAPIKQEAKQEPQEKIEDSIWEGIW